MNTIASFVSVLVLFASLHQGAAVRIKVKGNIMGNATHEIGPGSTVGGPYGAYIVQTFLGEGAYGKVYKAQDLTTGEDVVVKVIDMSKTDADTSYAQEKHIFGLFTKCANYPHPNIIGYKDVFMANKREGIVVMELADGGSLMKKLYDGVTVEVGSKSGIRTEFGTDLLRSEANAKQVFRMLAAGVAWLRSCDIMHQDLKPDNIMFTSDGTLKIIDFGLATHKEDGYGPDANMYYNLRSQPDRRKGKDMDTFDDFALGMLLAEFGTGVPPYFNPPYDYFSNKGNLNQQMGILYILWPDRLKQGTEKGRNTGDVGLFWPKKALGEKKLSLQTAVGQVAGRQYYFGIEGSHFKYSSALEQAVPEEYCEQSWLYRSQAAMDLLQKLMAFSPEERIDPSEILTHPWLADGSSNMNVPKQKPVKQQPMGHFLKPQSAAASNIQGMYNQGIYEDVREPMGYKPKLYERPVEVRQVHQEPVYQQPVKTGPDTCRSARPDTSGGPFRPCKIKVRDSEPCSVILACNDGRKVNIVLDSSGFGNVEVDNCKGCTVVG